MDPQLGATFYTLPQQHLERPRIQRDRHGECLACHATARTEKVPGFLVRSVFVRSDGLPNLSLGSTTTDHKTPFAERYGGWYVTGKHGDMIHRGNAVLRGQALDRTSCANRKDLPAKVDSDAYLEPTSDIVALMLLEHQSQMHNLITKAGYTAQRADYQQTLMNRILERPAEYRSESYQRRIQRVAQELVEYVFFCGEFQLTAPVEGNSKFVAAFKNDAVRDSQGRSLKDLDLNHRLLRFPCSYLVYSPSFLALPGPVLEEISKQMNSVLRGEQTSDRFAHLDAPLRASIAEILAETHPLF